MKRLDLAINDKTGILNIPVLTEKCQQEECISVFRSFKSYRSGELVRKEEKECMGNTLYIGSLQSEVYFCIYEKDYEQYKKNDIPIEDAEVKNRFVVSFNRSRLFPINQAHSSFSFQSERGLESSLSTKRIYRLIILKAVCSGLS